MAVLIHKHPEKGGGGGGGGERERETDRQNSIYVMSKINESASLLASHTASCLAYTQKLVLTRKKNKPLVIH